MKRHIIKTKDRTKNMKKSNKLIKRWGCLEFDGDRTLKLKLSTNKEIIKILHKKVEELLNKEGYELLDTFRLNRCKNKRSKK